jgi:hypothetical protein
VTSGATITVASYNMRKAIGLDRRRDPHRVLDVLHENRRRHRRASGGGQARRRARLGGAA